MLAEAESYDVTMVHPCAAPGCATLTMGEHCVEHELGAHIRLRARARHLGPRLLTASALVAAAVAGALVGTRLPR
jgi:hypothetical protein